MRISVYPLALAVAALAVVGCGKSEPPPPPPPPPAAPPATASAGEERMPLPPGHPPIDQATPMSAQSLPAAVLGQADNPQWTVPAGWEAGPASSVRRGSFLVKGSDGQTADIAVTVFPGDVGGLLGNVNRWRGQIGLPAAGPDDLAGFTSQLEVDGIASTVVDFAGTAAPAGQTQPQRMVVVTVPHAGNSWFFKMTGDAPLVEAQKETLLTFVRSVKF